MKQQQQVGAPNINVNPKDLDDINCEKCGNYSFIPVVLIKRLPALISPTQKETFIPMQVFACSSCNHINSVFVRSLGTSWFKGDEEEQEAPTKEVQSTSPIIESPFLDK